MYSREALILHIACLTANVPEGEDSRRLANTKAANMLGLGSSLLGSLPSLTALI
ncbi:hypothetical protein D3C85_1569680 [compost metagenome]